MWFALEGKPSLFLFWRRYKLRNCTKVKFIDLPVEFFLNNITYTLIKTKLCLCISLTALSIFCFAQSADSWYLSKILNDNTGLPQNSVRSMYFDKTTGFLWMTTEAGLVRYDGANTRIFDLRDMSSLTSIRLFTLFPTVNGDILGITRLGELFGIKDNYVLNKKGYDNLHVYDFSHQYGNARSFKDVGFEVKDTDSFTTRYGTVTSSLWLNDSLWIALSQSNVGVFNNQHLLHQWQYKKTGTTVLIERNGYVYVLNSNSSGYCINLNKNTFDPVMPGSKALAEGNPVLFYDKLNDQPVILNNNKLYELEFEANKISVKFIATLENLPTDITSIILHNKKRFVFVSTNTNGVYIYHLSPFRVYRAPGNGILNNNYGSVLIDSNHLFTCRSLLFDLTTGISHKISLPNLNSPSISLDTSNHIWSAADKNIVSFQLPGFDKIKMFPVADDNYLQTFFLSRNGRLWVSTAKFLGFIHNDEPKEYMPFEPVPDSSSFYYITETSDNRLIGVNNKGIYFVDSSLKTFIPILRSSQISPVRNINIEGDSLWWITTYGNGIYLYKTKTKKIIKLPVDDKGYLLYSHACIDDGNNNFLVPTNKGLFKLNKTNLLQIVSNPSVPLHYEYFDVSDGLLTNEFNGGPTPRLPGGDIILPALQGLVRVKTNELPGPSRYTVFIDLIETKEQTYTANTNIHFNQNERTQTWHVSVAQWSELNNQRIFFRTDQDTGWQKLLSGERDIRLSELTGGEHSLEIKNQYGLLPEQVSLLQYKFYIDKKYYETVWFWLIVLALAGTSVYLFIRFRTIQLKRNNKRLQKIIQQNIQELSGKNGELEETLHDLNGALDSLKENSVFKNRLIGLLGHDMLVPLRFIANISDHLYNDTGKLSPAMAKESSGEIKNTAAELLYLGESLIQWIKLEEGTFKLILGNINVGELANEIILVHKPIGAVKNNHIVCNIPAHLSCTHDRMFIKVLLHNLLLNANKFTSAGSIIIEAAVSDHFFTMHVTDTGVGMEPSVVASLNNLMPVAPQKGTHKEAGWGMGYMLIIDLLRFANGKLQVESNLGAGTKVSFSLPLQNLASKFATGTL